MKKSKEKNCKKYLVPKDKNFYLSNKQLIMDFSGNNEQMLKMSHSGLKQNHAVCCLVVHSIEVTTEMLAGL